MGENLAFWRESAKRARKGTASFANDWQWVFGSPAVAVGIGAYVASGKEAAMLTTGSPILDAFCAAFVAFLVTLLVAFLVNLIRVPAQIHREDAEKIEALKLEVENKAKRQQLREMLGRFMLQGKQLQ